MSLLLKALQNAARNREAAGNVRAESGSDAGERREPPTELSLEPVHPSPRAAARNHAAFAEEPAERQPQPGPQHAQTILRAGARPEPIRHREPGFFDWIAQRPLVAFSTAAGLFAIGYGIYLYLQITNPALFIARPTAAPPPPPPPPAVASAARTPQPPPPRVGESPTRSAPVPQEIHADRSHARDLLRRELRIDRQRQHLLGRALGTGTAARALFEVREARL